MNAPFWDITKSAPVHAAFAGVMASIGIAVLAILSASFLVGGTPKPGHSKDIYVSRFKPHIIHLLILAVLLLLVSAIVWGSIAGQPSNSEISAYATAGGAVAKPFVATMNAEDAVAGASAVTLLTTGSLALLAVLLELVPSLPSDSQEGQTTRFISRSFGMLAILGAYEVTDFTAVAIGLFRPRQDFHEDLVSLVVPLVIAMLCIPRRFLAGRDVILKRLQKLTWTDSVGSLQIRLIVVLAISDGIAYASSPAFNADLPQTSGLGLQDYIAAACALLAALLFLVFIVVMSWALVGPADQGNVEGGQQVRGGGKSGTSPGKEAPAEVPEPLLG